MIALKPIELYSVPSSTDSGESARILEGPTPAFRPTVVENVATDKKGPRVLEQRLQLIRKELEQQSREHSRLLEMIRIQAARLSTIEPLPGLFLARLEELLYLIEPKLKEVVVSEPITTTDELDKRFNRGIAQLRLLLNRDHVLENKELLEELTQAKLALQSKREEALQLRVEQEQLSQRLGATVEKLAHFDAEIASREERIAKLQKYVKESEVRHHKLFVDRRSIRNRRAVGDFTFIKDARHAKRGRQSWQVASIIVGLAVGCVVTLVSMRVIF